MDFDRVIVLDKGEIVESGRPKELLATPGSGFKLLWESMNRLEEEPAVKAEETLHGSYPETNP